MGARAPAGTWETYLQEKMQGELPWGGDVSIRAFRTCDSSGGASRCARRKHGKGGRKRTFTRSMRSCSVVVFGEQMISHAGASWSRSAMGALHLCKPVVTRETD